MLLKRKAAMAGGLFGTNEMKWEQMEWVTDLPKAYDAYWTAKTPREKQAAHHEILLFGGVDGYGVGGWRERVVRQLRRLACWLERD
jgi:hypothetical protein